MSVTVRSIKAALAAKDAEIARLQGHIRQLIIEYRQHRDEELRAAMATLEDEQAAHQDTLRLLAAKDAEIALLLRASVRSDRGAASE